MGDDYKKRIVDFIRNITGNPGRHPDEPSPREKDLVEFLEDLRRDIERNR